MTRQSLAFGAALVVLAWAGTSGQQATDTVYYGFGNPHYHKKDCQRIAGFKQVESMSLAKAQETLQPCPYCRPDGGKAPLVYTISSSGDYHLKTCWLAKGRTITPLVFTGAIAGGMRPCLVCHPEQDPEIVAFNSARDKARQESLAADRKAAQARDALAAKAAAAKKIAAAADGVRRADAPLRRVTEQEARAAATAAAGVAKNDAAAFENEFRSRIRSIAPEYAGLQAVHHSAAITIAVFGPVAKFEWSARERVRKFEALTGIAWSDGISIVVSPAQIDAPDIEKIIIQRNDVAVPPVRSELVRQELVTRMGAKRLIHSGAVVFPVSAFAPGSTVNLRIIAVPASGANIVKTFTGLELRSIH